jgi:hypothetical protein
LDFEGEDNIRLKRVEIFPILANERADLVDQIGRFITEILS